MSEAVKVLISKRAELNNEMNAIRHQIVGLDMAIQLLSGAAPNADGKVPVRDIIESLLRERGEAGIGTAALIVMAANRGILLKPGSVRTTLNRMQRDGIVLQDETHTFRLRYASLAEEANKK